ncbi:MAG: ABC transporter ATP-binding protein [Bacteroidota bacterium]
MSQPIFSASNLSVYLQGTRILDDLQFTLQAGQLIGIIGPNGSGKTTLLRAISGLLPYEGTLAFKGEAVADWDTRKRAQAMAVLPQVSSITFDFRVRDYVTLGRLPHKGWLENENKDDLSQVDAVLEMLDLVGLADRTLPSLSGGERQRVLLAQALVQETETLLLDEPTSHLDVYHQFDLLKRLRGLVTAGKTVVVVFHDLTMAARFTDTLLALKDGRLVAAGATREVLTTQLIQDLFGMATTLTYPEHAPPQIQFIDQI